MFFKQILPEEDRFLSSACIHPLKQRQISELVKKAKYYLPVKRIVVFGSALTLRCHQDSDIDIVVWDKKRIFQPPPNDKYDLVYADMLTPEWSAYNDIVNEGVIVYERDAD